MYRVDDRDEVVELRGIPQPDPDAPCPAVVANQAGVGLTYLTVGNRHQAGSDPKQNMAEEVALIRFPTCIAHYFGPPNDESIAGHPLAERGLKPCGVFEVRQSSWIREAERYNTGRQALDAAWLLKYRHFVFAFHDELFECIGSQIEIRETALVSDAVVTELARFVGEP
ncbi:MAG: hypothetical protein AAGB51_07285 [Planctomycetota bacterium]